VSTYPLLEYVQATADANGRAVVSNGPHKFGESWTITSLNTTTNSVAESQLRVYRGVESDSAIVASSYSGNQDSAGGSEIKVPAQDKLVFVWSGADPGAQCTCRIEGDLVSGRI
jgi:hypothetical protein